MSVCFCMGPQNGEPLCPCQMRAARSYLGEVKALVSPLGENLIAMEDSRPMFHAESTNKGKISIRSDFLLDIIRGYLDRENYVVWPEEVDWVAFTQNAVLNDDGDSYYTIQWKKEIT